MREVYALVRQIRQKRLPRNRFFDTHASIAGRHARKLDRFLRAIERDVLQADRVVVSRRSDRIVVQMDFSAVRSSRRVVLSQEEHALLRESGAVAARLG